MTTFFSKFRRNPIGFLAALSYFTLVTHGAPSGSAASVHLARDESHPVGALYCTPPLNPSRAIRPQANLYPCLLVMTNDPTENSVVAGQILADGSVVSVASTIFEQHH